MTPQELANLLDGREYPFRGLPSDEAAKMGLVIAYGASDDLAEMEGAIKSESYCYNGATITIGRIRDTWQVLDSHDDCECEFCGYKNIRAAAIAFQWCPDGNDGPSWRVVPAFPHATFRVMEDGNVFCEGAVFSVDDLEKAAKPN